MRRRRNEEPGAWLIGGTVAMVAVALLVLEWITPGVRSWLAEHPWTTTILATILTIVLTYLVIERVEKTRERARVEKIESLVLRQIQRAMEEPLGLIRGTDQPGALGPDEARALREAWVEFDRECAALLPVMLLMDGKVQEALIDGAVPTARHLLRDYLVPLADGDTNATSADGWQGYVGAYEGCVDTVRRLP